MKRALLGAMLLALAIVAPIPSTAQVGINVRITVPPPVPFKAPPDVIVIPDTNDVYVVPYIDADLFFWNGLWWRLWEGRWYRSRYYNRGWAYYNGVPGFYFDVDPGWRGYYRDRSWHGHRWNYERIPHRNLQRNWQAWHNSQHWERQRTWDVQGYQPRPRQQRQELRRERQQQYHERPEAQEHHPQRPHQGQQPQRFRPQERPEGVR